jgi:hypothetical protein
VVRDKDDLVARVACRIRKELTVVSFCHSRSPGEGMKVDDEIRSFACQPVFDGPSPMRTLGAPTLSLRHVSIPVPEEVGCCRFQRHLVKVGGFKSEVQQS